jgi:CheY-like chemotaxis protein
MQKILVVDDDPVVRQLIRTRLQSTYEIFDTGDPEKAFGLALMHKPDAILVDLMMPGYSGFELCQSLHSVSYTSHIPVFVVTGESGSKFKEHCKSLGARGYFEKPVDFSALKQSLNDELRSKQADRRAHLRVPLKVILKLVGRDETNNLRTESVTTENISAGGFLCGCAASLVKDAIMEVYLVGQEERYVGMARVVRKESPGAPWQKYGFAFTEKNEDWLLQ